MNTIKSFLPKRAKSKEVSCIVLIKCFLTTSLFLLFQLLFHEAQAQTNFMTKSAEYCWVNEHKEYSDCKMSQEEEGLFTLSEGATMFTHINEDGEYSFSVKSTREFENGDGWVITTVNEKGQDVLISINYKRESIELVYISKPGMLMLSVEYFVKSIF